MYRWKRISYFFSARSTSLPPRPALDMRGRGRGRGRSRVRVRVRVS